MKRGIQCSVALAVMACLTFGFAALSSAQLGAPAKPVEVNEKTHQNYTDKINDKVSFEMIAIPGGRFVMGSPDSEKGRNKDEGPEVAVFLKPFWMGKLEVTWDEFDWFWTKRFPGGQPPPRPDISKKPEKISDAITSPTPPYADETFGHGRERNPVLAISHHAAMEYCRWLSVQTNKKYRLPTEAEWEWACRAGTRTAYSFGDDVGKLTEYAWFDKNSEEVAHKVGEKKPNPWGLHDIHGNVAEWCIDRYDAGFYGRFKLAGNKLKISLNEFNPPTENRYGYVARGGSWIDPAEKLRSAARRASDKTWLLRDPQSPKSIWWMTEADYVGFRVVRAVEEYDNLKDVRSKVTWWSPD